MVLIDRRQADCRGGDHQARRQQEKDPDEEWIEDRSLGSSQPMRSSFGSFGQPQLLRNPIDWRC
jgi:hypothetical protein